MLLTCFVDYSIQCMFSPPEILLESTGGFVLCWWQRVGSIRTLHKNRQLRILILCFSSKYKDSRQTIIFLGSCKHPNNRGAPQLPLFKTRQLHLPRSAVPKFQKCQHVSKVRLQYIRSGHIKVIIREGLENLQWYSSVKGARGYPEYANFLKCLVRGGTPLGLIR